MSLQRAHLWNGWLMDGMSDRLDTKEEMGSKTTATADAVMRFVYVKGVSMA